MRVGVLILACLVVAGCKEDVALAPVEDPCGAVPLQALVGQDRSALAEAGVTEGRDVRILPPGAVVTMDHRPDRLNIDLDDDDRVVRLRCG